MAKIIGGILYDDDGVMIENQAASTASTVSALVTDFNALLSKLKASGLMAADAESAG